MKDYPKCRRTTWSDAERWADALADQLRAARHRPDAIVALTRGGWVPARLLADRLKLKRLVTVRAQHWGVTATPSGKAEITEGLSGPIDGLDVLVVDDITDTGQSLHLAVEAARAAGAKRVESATCLHITHSEFQPTYFAEAIGREEWVWVVFPWNYWEDLATLGHRALAEAGSAEGALRLLKERCQLDVPAADLAAVLDGRRAPG